MEAYSPSNNTDSVCNLLEEKLMANTRDMTKKLYVDSTIQENIKSQEELKFYNHTVDIYNNLYLIMVKMGGQYSN